VRCQADCLGILSCVGLALRWFEPQIDDLRKHGITVHGLRYRVRFKSVGDLKWRSEQLKGQLGHNFSHFDSCIPIVSLSNKSYLHALNISESSLNTYGRRLEAKREFDETFASELKRRRGKLSDKSKHALKLDILKRSCRTALLQREDLRVCGADHVFGESYRTQASAD
jgi:hypothetical protein